MPNAPEEKAKELRNALLKYRGRHDAEQKQ
jgi:hypothetical protein